MTEMPAALTSLAVLNRLVEYAKYLYDEEKARTDRIEQKVKIFVLALGGTILGFVAKIPPAAISGVFLLDSFNDIISTLLLLVTLLLYLLSSICLFQVFRVRRFERLTDPVHSAKFAVSVDDESAFLSSMIADFTVATNRNYKVNEKKARYLSYALHLLVFALAAAMLSYLFLTARSGSGG